MNGWTKVNGRFLLDTNVVIALFKGDAAVQENLARVGGNLGEKGSVKRGKEVQKMDVLEVFEDEIKEYKRLKIISEMVLVREHIKLFEQKYGCGFQEFEKRVEQEAENFAQWDDYIEWKAYQKSFEGLKKKIGEIEHAKGIRITE